MIGCGRWGPNLVRNFSSLEGASLTAVCDLDQDKLGALGERYPGLCLAADYRELLGPGGPQAVVIATPIPTHYAIARDCLEAGRHVLVEKPLCTHADQAQELAGLADARGLVLMVGHLLEYHPAVVFLKHHLQSGALGRALEIHARRVNPTAGRNGEGAMWGLAPHDISVASYLLGAHPLRVQAARSTHGRGEETVSLEVSYPDSAVLHLEVSWRDPQKVRCMTIVGTRQLAVFDDLAPDKVRIYANGHHQAEPDSAEQPFVPEIEVSEPLRQECLHFVECIHSGHRPRSDSADGIHVVRVLEAAESSLRQGGAPVTI